MLTLRFNHVYHVLSKTHNFLIAKQTVSTEMASNLQVLGAGMWFKQQKVNIFARYVGLVGSCTMPILG
jgi:hypothetical protein